MEYSQQIIDKVASMGFTMKEIVYPLLGYHFHLENIMEFIIEEIPYIQWGVWTDDESIIIFADYVFDIDKFRPSHVIHEPMTYLPKEEQTIERVLEELEILPQLVETPWMLSIEGEEWYREGVEWYDKEGCYYDRF